MIDLRLGDCLDVLKSFSIRSLEAGQPEPRVSVSEGLISGST